MGHFRWPNYLCGTEYRVREDNCLILRQKHKQDILPTTQASDVKIGLSVGTDGVNSREGGLAEVFVGCISRVPLTRLRRIVACIWPNQKNQPNLDLYLVRRYKICHLPLVVSYLCISQNQKNQPNLVLYRVQRSKIFVSVTTLSAVQGGPTEVSSGN